MTAILLALSLSVDALGIGISYGLRNIKTPFSAKVIISFLSFFITAIAILCGNFILLFLPPEVAKWGGALMLIFLGLFIVFSNLLKKPEGYDIDHSQHIDIKEAFFLGTALSIDSFGTGICSAVMGLNSLFIPLMVALCQLLFLCGGNLLGKKLRSVRSLPPSVFTILSGLLLIIIALIRLFY